MTIGRQINPARSVQLGEHSLPSIPSVTQVNDRHESLVVCFDPAAEIAIRQLQEQFLKAGLINHLPPGRPHFTLACSNQIKLDQIREDPTVANLRELSNIELYLQSTGLFARADGTYVLFLTPAFTSDFIRLHHAAYSFFLRHASDSLKYYQPDQLTPHCTLAASIASTGIAAALDLIAEARVLPLKIKLVDLLVLSVPEQNEYLLHDSASAPT